MTNNKVRSYAERIERLLDERAAIDADIKDIYTEVKSADLKPKVLRKAIANKRRKVDKQFEADVEEYAALLLALPGATYRSVAEQTGISKSRLQRRVPQSERGTSTPHDPETGEINDGRSSQGTGGSDEPPCSGAGAPEPERDDAGSASLPPQPDAEHRDAPPAAALPDKQLLGRSHAALIPTDDELAAEGAALKAARDSFLRRPKQQEGEMR